MLFFDKLFLKKADENAATGKKIRQLRNAKHISAKELGAACGVNETAIRNYEQGIRQVSDEKLDLIANFLGVTQSALYDRKVVTYIDVMQILFQFADRYELLPAAIPQEPRFALISKDPVLVGLIQVWYEQRRKWECKEITLEQLQEWENAFPLRCKEDLVNHGDMDTADSIYTDFERIVFLKRAVEEQKLIVSNYCQMVDESLQHKDIATARMHIETLQKTINSVFENDIKKYG